MHIEIVTQNLFLDIYGFSGTAIHKDYSGTAFKLMDRMWQVVKSAGLKNKGMNIWVYEPDDLVFAGVELTETPLVSTGMERKNINLTQYACYKHIGSYNQIKYTGQIMREELTRRGFEVILPYIEIYGHWTNDENRLETELLMCVK